MRAAALVLVLSGCSLLNAPSDHTGGDAGPADAPPIPIDANQLCNELAQLACDAADECCSLGEPTALCVTDVRAACDMSFGMTLLRDDRVGYDGARAAAAFAYARSLVATCDPDIFEWYDDQARGFPSALAGTILGGATCTPMSLTPGSVDTPAFYSCASDTQSCIYNGSDRWTCTERAGLGETCYLQLDCDTGLFCERPGSGVGAGTCAMERAPGQPCTEDGGECADVCYLDTCVEVTADAVYCSFAPVDFTSP